MIDALSSNASQSVGYTGPDLINVAIVNALRTGTEKGVLRLYEYKALVDALSDTLFDPISGNKYLLQESFTSPNLHSIRLPTLDGISFYDVRTLSDGEWSNFEIYKSGYNVIFGADTRGVEFDPLGQDYNPVEGPDGLVFALSFDAAGEFDGTLRVIDNDAAVSQVPLPSTGLLSLASLGWLYVGSLVWKRWRTGTDSYGHRYQGQSGVYQL